MEPVDLSKNPLVYLKKEHHCEKKGYAAIRGKAVGPTWYSDLLPAEGKRDLSVKTLERIRNGKGTNPLDGITP